MGIKVSVVAAALATGVAFVGSVQASALVVDDWNINANTGNSISPPPSPTASSRTATGGTSLTRDLLYLNNVGGLSGVSAPQISDCSTCQAGSFSGGDGAHGSWSWGDLNGLNLSAYSTAGFDYSADRVGADVILSFWSAGGTPTLLGSLQASDLAATSGGSISFDLSAIAAGLTSVDYIFLDVFSIGGAFTDTNSKFGGVIGSGSWGLGTLALGQGVPDLDFTIDNLALVNGVPEPGTIALVGLALAGLGVARRRRI